MFYRPVWRLLRYKSSLLIKKKQVHKTDAVVNTIIWKIGVEL
jgi:hypothetical protein